MIINFNQIKSNLTFEYEATTDNNKIAQVKQGLFYWGYKIVNTFNDNTSYVVFSNTKRSFKIFFASLREYFAKERLMYKYYIKNQTDEEIGSIIDLRRKTGFLKAYRYYKMVVNNDSLNFYHIGLGKKGTYICIYKNDKQIGLIDKPIEVKDNLDTYIIYLENDKYVKEVITFLSHFDMRFYGNKGEYAYKKKEYRYIYTFNKELLSKFNEEFVNKIVNKEKKKNDN